MRDALRWVCEAAKGAGAAFADARAVDSTHTNLRRQDGKTDRLRQGTSLGVGIRVLLEGAWGFASTNETSRDDLKRCLEAAVDMAKASQARVEEPGVVAALDAHADEYAGPCEVDPRSVAVERKMEVVNALEAAALAQTQERTANSFAWYGDEVTREIVCNTQGADIDQTVTRTRLGARVTAVEGEVRQNGVEHESSLGGFEVIERVEPTKLGGKAGGIAVMLLGAARAPSGKFPVILHPSIVGVFIHEALGHNAEADHIISGDSILEGKFGTPVASELVTVVDDATIPLSWGSYQYDSEGTPGQRRMLIENGVLKGYMHSLETAAKLGLEPNGSGRADGYASRPIVRMSNTIVLPGASTLEDLAQGIDLGVLLEGGEWGYVMTAKGQYTCHAGRGRMIRNGQIAEPLRDVSVAGMILDTLANVDGVTEAFEMLTMGGMCGKSGQSMPTNGGGPYLRVKELIVGGQERV
ncbi:MAG: TldD/PmbA family protein [Armatimonadetes bacterium]|nr:TldD/PmbA family protein [Armatimonadota bacterium]